MIEPIDDIPDTAHPAQLAALLAAEPPVFTSLSGKDKYSDCYSDHNTKLKEQIDHYRPLGITKLLNADYKLDCLTFTITIYPTYPFLVQDLGPPRLSLTLRGSIELL